MNRLQFIKNASAFAASSLAYGCLSKCRNNERYSVSILGDVHYDATERNVYHANYRPEIPWKARVCEREFKRNAEMWKDRLPRLISSAAAVRTADTAFLLQLGDLIQGDCCDRKLHDKMLIEAKKACCKAPFCRIFFQIHGSNSRESRRDKWAEAAQRRCRKAPNDRWWYPFPWIFPPFFQRRQEVWEKRANNPAPQYFQVPDEEGSARRNTWIWKCFSAYGIPRRQNMPHRAFLRYPRNPERS